MGGCVDAVGVEGWVLLGGERWVEGRWASVRVLQGWMGVGGWMDGCWGYEWVLRDGWVLWGWVLWDGWVN